MDDFKGIELFMNMDGERVPLKFLRNVLREPNGKFLAISYRQDQYGGDIGFSKNEITEGVYKQLKIYLDAKTIL